MFGFRSSLFQREFLWFSPSAARLPPSSPWRPQTDLFVRLLPRRRPRAWDGDIVGGRHTGVVTGVRVSTASKLAGIHTAYQPGAVKSVYLPYAGLICRDARRIDLERYRPGAGTGSTPYWPGAGKDRVFYSLAGSLATERFNGAAWSGRQSYKITYIIQADCLFRVLKSSGPENTTGISSEYSATTIPVVDWEKYLTDEAPVSLCGYCWWICWISVT
jgi:hypothetical protein